MFPDGHSDPTEKRVLSSRHQGDKKKEGMRSSRKPQGAGSELWQGDQPGGGNGMGAELREILTKEAGAEASA